jgi:hypothetical protein
MSAKSDSVHLANAAKLPQAGDDRFNFFESSDGWYTLSVLDNDKGGNAKHIVAVDGLDPALIDDYSINDDGTISVHVVGLNPGVVTALEFNYTIQLGNGALSAADVELHVASTESLLANGSFEDPAVAPATWTVTNIPGWTNTGGAGIEVWQSGYLGANATDGTFLIETDSFGAVDDVLSTTADAETGVTYTLTFDFAARIDGPHGGTDMFEIWWNGTQVGAFDPTSTVWQTASIEVVGADGIDTLQIREAGANDNYGALIDNVSVVIIGSEWMV